MVKMKLIAQILVVLAIVYGGYRFFLKPSAPDLSGFDKYAVDNPRLKNNETPQPANPMDAWDKVAAENPRLKSNQNANK